MDEQLHTTLAELRAEVAQLSDLFTRRLLEDKARKSLYDALQDQVRESRDLLRQKEVEGLVREMLLAVDRLRSEPASQELVESVVQEIHEVFGRRGVSEIRSHGVFDASIHEVIDTVEAGAGEVVGEIVVSHRPGYRLGGRLLRAAQVTVRVVPTQVPMGAPAPEEGIHGHAEH